MTEKIPWWKVFSPKKKSEKEASVFGPDFDPWAQPAEKCKDSSPSFKTTSPDYSVPAQGNNLLSDETFDDSKLESVFNEQTCRRNMKVSRSGRFKEKRRPRSTLPIEEKGREGAMSGREEKR